MLQTNKQYQLITSLALFAALAASCTIKINMSGASLSPDCKTANIAWFQNKARLVQPQLSRTLTEKLKDKVLAQTSLTLVNDGGDVVIDGTITDYNTQPVAIQANNTAASNRLTITLKVRYKNNKDKTFDFDQTFTHFADYDSNRSLQSVENDLIEEITNKLVEDIFNKAFVNW